MAWIYLAEAEDSQKHFTSGSTPLLTVKSTQELSACSCPGWPGESYLWPRSGLTCGRCGGICSRPWMPSQEDSRARISALLELERAWQAAEAALCLNTSASLASASPDGSSWKTYQLSLFGDSTEYSWDSMRWGMMRGGQLFQPQRWAPRTCESESGFLPTPAASEYGSNQSPSPGAQVRPSLSQMARQNLWPTSTVFGNHNAPKEGTSRGTGLSTAVKRWPTPKASEASRGDSPSERRRNSPCLSSAVIWRTPNASDYKNRGERGPGQQIQLQTQVGGQLNPTWVEWLMGWPIGSTVSESWVTESSHFARKRRSCASQESSVRHD